MGNVSLKVLEKSLKFLFKNGYKPWIYPVIWTRMLSRVVVFFFGGWGGGYM